jgi:Rha family phage regulatory protein
MIRNALISQNQLVETRAGKAVTTSLLIADKFGKRHSHVLEAIQKIEAPQSFTEPNFRLSEYTDPTGRALPMYSVTRDGFMFLAMGFKGKKAAEWKVKFIGAFSLMEERLLRQHNLSWQQVRLEGKTVRRELTDAVSEFVEYATLQGSQNARLYFQSITMMTYRALFFVKAASPKPFRDMLDTMQAIFLATAEYIARQALIEGMQQHLHYKDIYKLARDRVTAYAATLPQQLMIAA